MLQAAWNLPPSIEDYCPGEAIGTVVSIWNPSPAPDKGVVVLMLLNLRGYLLVAPDTGKPYYQGVVREDSTFEFSKARATLFELGPAAEVTLPAVVTSPMTGCLLALITMDEAQKQRGTFLLCHLAAPASGSPISEVSTSAAELLSTGLSALISSAGVM